MDCHDARWLIQDTYNEYKSKWASRNDLHTQAVERAAADRVLFLNEASAANRYVDLRFPDKLAASVDLSVTSLQGSLRSQGS